MGNQAKTTPARESKVERARAGQRSEGKSSRGGASLLFASGTLMLLAAGFVDLAPRYFPNHAWIQRSASRRGLTAGTLALAGMAVGAMGWMTRSLKSSKSDGKQEVDRGLVLDQLAVDLAQLRGGMQELRVDFVYLKDASQSILTAVREHGTSGSTRDQQDAMFRLAASLDQVGERLDQRIQLQHTQAHQSLSGLQESIAGLRTQMTDFCTMSSQARPMPNGSISNPSWSADIGRPRARSQSGEVDVWVELEEGDDTNLGLLDTLDEYGRAPQSRTSLKMDPEFRGDGESQPVISSHDLPQGPLPNRRPHATHSGIAPGTDPTAIHGDESVASMIDSLRALLSDARVRHALASLGEHSREPS